MPIYVEKDNGVKSILYLNTDNNSIKKIQKKDNTLVYGIAAATILPIFLKELVKNVNHYNIVIIYLLSFIIGMVYTYINKKNLNKILEDSQQDNTFDVEKNIANIYYFLDDDIQRWKIMRIFSVCILLFGLYLLVTNALNETWFIITNLGVCIIPESFLCSQSKMKKNICHKLKLQLDNSK